MRTRRALVISMLATSLADETYVPSPAIDERQPGAAFRRKTATLKRSGLSSPARRNRATVPMLGVRFDHVTLEQTVERIDEMVRSREPHYVVTPNVDFLVQAERDAALRQILLDAHLVL